VEDPPFEAILWRFADIEGSLNGCLAPEAIITTRSGFDRVLEFIA
jgi:hypothetical protein